MDAKAVSSTISRFAAKFCNELEKNKNVISSPLSAEFVLALLTLGATEPAHKELISALGLPDDDTIRSSFRTVSAKLKSVKGVTLNVANRVYVKEGPFELVPQLEKDAMEVFDAGIQKLNFSDSVGAAKHINNWVESKTNNKIKDLLSPDSFGDDTRLVLVNALYFKGSWKSKFDQANTMEQPFHVNAKTTINIPMMYQEHDFKYGVSQELQAQFLEMPYEGGDTSMVIVLPNEIEGLDGVLQKLADGYDLMSDLDKLFSMKVQVTIPKFKIETEIDLAELLPKLGIQAIFDPGHSGLDKILNNNEPLFVSKAVQKAYIEVNEEGAEAAAATGMVMMLRCARPPPPRFFVDRPFLYILSGADRSTLFVGVYRDNA